MFEDLEGLSSVTKDFQKGSELSNTELEYVRECVEPPRPEILAERIDELQGGDPPKAIDSNPQIAEIIEPIRDQIPSRYLEAPNDMEQVEQISDVMKETVGLNVENWGNLSLNQRAELLNQLEGKVADIEHRPACPIDVKDLEKITEKNGEIIGEMGYYQKAGERHVLDPDKFMPVMIYSPERIVINSNLVESNNPICFEEVLNTLIHEGRHAYQTYNLEYRETHTSQGDLTNWHTNIDKFGYQDAKPCGFRAYWMQPVESDARKFAEDVLNAYKEKL